MSSKEDSYLEKEEKDASLVGVEKSIGVERAEILAAQYDTWYYKSLLLFSVLLVGYAFGLDSQVRSVYTGYATGSYSKHSLLSTVSVITSVMGAACQPVYARLSDIFGRLELFIVTVIFYVVGTIIESQAVDVQKYAAGAIFYELGYAGALLVIWCILGDFSSTRWRLFYFFVPYMPFIINTWISGNVTSDVGMDWKWGIGMWAFIYPLACIPFVACLIHMRWLAGKTEDWRIMKQRNTYYQEHGFKKFMVFLFWKLDLIGLTLMTLSFIGVLVPLTLAGGVKSKWKEGYILGPLIVGILLFPAFVFWEAKFARFPIVPWHLLKDRGVWSALSMSFLYDFIFYIESSYLYTVLMVAINESEKSATRISSLGSFTGCVASIFYGLLMVYFRRLKPFIIFGTSLWLVGLGIMYHFRVGLGAHAGVIGSICLIGLATTFFSYPINISLQTCTDHEHMAIVISLGLTVYRVGAAVGTAVAGAVWSQLLYKRLVKYMGETLALTAYSDPYTFIVLHPWGTTVRNQMVHAYKDIQKILIIIAMVFCVPLIILSFFLRDHKLGEGQTILDEEKEDKSFLDDMRDLFKREKTEPKY